MEYDLKTFEEDKKIAWFVFRKYFYKYRMFCDDMMQCALMRLYRCHDKFNESLGTKGTFLCCVAKNAMLCFLKYEWKQKQPELELSYEVKLDDDEKVALIDTLGEEYDFDKNFNYEYLKKICDEVAKDCCLTRTKKIGFASHNVYKIIQVYLNTFSFAETARICNCSRQRVEQLIKKFRFLAQEKYKQDNF